MKTASPSHINTTPITPNTRRGDDGILTAWKALLTMAVYARYRDIR